MGAKKPYQNKLTSTPWGVRQIQGEIMPVSTVHVNRNGSPAASAKVMLSFSTSGVTGTEYTDRDGRATISHTASGTATVFVNGSNRGTMRAPGSISVDI